MDALVSLKDATLVMQRGRHSDMAEAREVSTDQSRSLDAD